MMQLLLLLHAQLASCVRRVRAIRKQYLFVVDRVNEMRERELGVADAASSFFAGTVGELCEKDPSGSNTSCVS